MLSFDGAKVVGFWKVHNPDFVAFCIPNVWHNKGCPPDTDETPSLFNKPQTNGSLAHITAIFGFTLAGLVIQDAIKA